MSIPAAFIQELVARADVVDIVGRHVQLKKGGANFMGLCPFHGEKSPSFSVSPSKQFYHCFGCGKNGNVISFLMDFSGMGFVDAVKELAQQYGMQVPEEDASPEDRARAAAQRERQQTLSDVLEKANAAYRKELKTATRAVDYLKGRGVSGQVAKDFGLGYAPEGWRSLASVFPHYDDPLLVESGLVIFAAPEDGGEEKRYDRFRDRVMFPIRNVKGECIGFGARVLGDEKPKYLNSPETPVFSKGRELYGLFEARTHLREAGYALVTEGYMDVVALAQLGFPNAVATLGTACTADHVQKLFRFTDAVVFSFDGDAAGRRAAHKALEAALPFATDVRSVKFLFLPPEHDPDSYVRAHGRDGFADMVKQATPLSKFVLESAAQDCDLETAEGRAQLATHAKALWTQLPEGALKMQIFTDIAALVQIGPRELAALWGNATPERAPARRNPAAAQGAGRYDVLGDARKPAARRGRTQPLSRADHALRIALMCAHLWERLSPEDHSALCQLPGSHGACFSWLEAQIQEDGPMTWNALRERMLEEAPELFATTQMVMAEALQPAGDGSEEFKELRNLLSDLEIDRIKALQKTISAGQTLDPQALQTYKTLDLRLKELQRLRTEAIL